jgi:transcriptional regulator with XRE-family HTH domain
MSITKKIKMALAAQNISEAELARRLGVTPGAFNQRMKRGMFATTDLQKIANAIGIKYSFFFELPDGTKI